MTETSREKIQADIQRHSESITDAAGRQMTVLFEDRGIELAGAYGCHLRVIYQLALSDAILPFRYLRNQQAITTNDQLKLCAACVAVAGAGGLGGYVSDILARMGIGALILIDPDIFTESNLNRQRFALNETLHMPKVTAAEKLIKSINPAVEVSGHQEKLTPVNGAQLLEGAAVAVDALDNIADRLVLQEVCAKAGIPMVHGAVAGFEGQVLTVMPGDTGLKNLYEEDRPQAPSPESVLGVPAIAPMMVGGWQVMEVLKILLNRGGIFSNTMVYVDLESANLEKFRVGG